MKVKEIKPEILVLEYIQERNDEYYGSCFVGEVLLQSR